MLKWASSNKCLICCSAACSSGSAAMLLAQADQSYWSHASFSLSSSSSSISSSSTVIFKQNGRWFLAMPLICSVLNWDQPNLACKGTYPRVIRCHHKTRPRPQSSLSRGQFIENPGFTKMALGKRWLGIIQPFSHSLDLGYGSSEWPYNIGAKFNSLKTTGIKPENWHFSLNKSARFGLKPLQFWGCWI